MDANLIAARAAYEASRRAPKNSATPEPVTSGLSLQALVEFWQRNADAALNFCESEFNYISLINCLVTLIYGKQRPATVETVSEAYNECVASNHLELPRRTDGNGATIRKRGEKTLLPPTLYPAYEWPAQAEAASREALDKQMTDWLAGKKLAQKRTTEDLAAEVRAKYKPPRPGGPTTWS